MAAPERFAETSDSSCIAGAVHTWHSASIRCGAEVWARLGGRQCDGASTPPGRLHPALPFAIIAINQKPREDFAMTRWATLAIGFLAFCSCSVTGPAQAQSGEGWITLFDGKNLDHWQGDGKRQFRDR